MAHIMNRSWSSNQWALGISTILVFLFWSLTDNSLDSQGLKCLTLTEVWHQDNVWKTHATVCRIQKVR